MSNLEAKKNILCTQIEIKNKAKNNPKLYRYERSVQSNAEFTVNSNISFFYFIIRLQTNEIEEK